MSKSNKTKTLKIDNALLTKNNTHKHIFFNVLCVYVAILIEKKKALILFFFLIFSLISDFDVVGKHLFSD